MSAPTPIAARLPPLSTRCRNTHSGSTGSARPALHRRRRRRAARRPGRARRRTASTPTAQALPPSSRPRISSEQPTVSSAAPAQVEVVLALHDALAEVPAQRPGGEQPERQVDEEDPAPGEVLAEDAAQRRSEQRGQPPDRRDVALHLRALRDAVQVADDREPDRLDRAGADALQQPAGDERRHRPGQPAQHGRGEEDPDPEQQQRLAADDVGELAVHRHRHGLRQQVGAEQPRELAEAAEVVDHARHGGRDDRAVDGDQAGAQHDRAEDRTALRPQAHRGAGRGAGRSPLGATRRVPADSSGRLVR